MTKKELVAEVGGRDEGHQESGRRNAHFSGEDFAGQPEESREHTHRRFRYLWGCTPKGPQWSQSSNESQNQDSGLQGS